jgi:hypothetical protein
MQLWPGSKKRRPPFHNGRRLKRFNFAYNKLINFSLVISSAVMYFMSYVCI